MVDSSQDTLKSAPWLQAVEALRRRHNFRQFQLALFHLVLSLCAAGLAAICLTHWHRFAAVGLGLAGAAVALGGHAAWLRRRWLSAQASPLWLDRQLDLKARLVTAHEFAAEGEAHPLFELLVNQLQGLWPSRLAGATQGDTRGLPDRRALYALIAALAIVWLLLWRPPGWSIGKPLGFPPAQPPPPPTAQVPPPPPDQPPQDQSSSQQRQDQSGEGGREQDQSSGQGQGGSQDQRSSGSQSAKSQQQSKDGKGSGSGQAETTRQDRGSPDQRAQGGSKGQGTTGQGQEGQGQEGSGAPQRDGERPDKREQQGDGATPASQAAQDASGASSGSEAQLKQEIHQLLQQLEGQLAQMEASGSEPGAQSAQSHSGGKMIGPSAEPQPGQAEKQAVGDQSDPELLGEPETMKSTEGATPIEVKIQGAPSPSSTSKRPIQKRGPSPTAQTTAAKPTTAADPSVKVSQGQEAPQAVESSYVPDDYREILKRVKEHMHGTASR